MHFYLSQPLSHVIKGLSVVYGIGKENSHCPPVVGLGNGPESFLTSCVPYLHSYFFAIDLYSFSSKINSDCSEMGVHKIVLSKSQ